MSIAISRFADVVSRAGFRLTSDKQPCPIGGRGPFNALSVGIGYDPRTYHQGQIAFHGCTKADAKPRANLPPTTLQSALKNQRICCIIIDISTSAPLAQQNRRAIQSVVGSGKEEPADAPHSCTATTLTYVDEKRRTQAWSVKHGKRLNVAKWHHEDSAAIRAGGGAFIVWRAAG